MWPTRIICGFKSDHTFWGGGYFWFRKKCIRHKNKYFLCSFDFSSNRALDGKSLRHETAFFCQGHLYLIHGCNFIIKVRLDSGCWDITVTSNCCQAGLFTTDATISNFSFGIDFLPSRLTLATVPVFWKLFPQKFPADLIIRKSFNENPLSLMKITVGLIVNKKYFCLFPPTI